MKIINIPSKAILVDREEIGIIYQALFNHHEFLQDSYDEEAEDAGDIIDQVVDVGEMLQKLKDHL